MTDAGIVEKMMILRDSEDKISGFVLPTGISAEQISTWTKRFLMNALSKAAIQQRKLERFEGRTFKEDWAKPTGTYFNIGSNSNADDFNLGIRILELIENEGRHTIDELRPEFGAVDPEPFAIVVNMLRGDHYLKNYEEHDGTHTLELVTKKERMRLLGLDDRAKAMEDKEKK
jgi:hypothetical protein